MSEASTLPRKIRCLQIITRSDWAGGQKVLYALVKGLNDRYKNEIEIEVACGKENGILIKELEDIGIKVHVVPDLVREISLAKDLKAYFELKKIIKQGNFNVVHLHSSKAGILGRIAAKKCMISNIIYTVHGWWSLEQYRGLKQSLLVFAERFAAKYCDKIVFLCQREKEKAKIWKIGNEKQYVVIPNAIIPIENLVRGQLRVELGIPKNVKIVGNVARLDPPKNPIRFLSIAKEVISKLNDVVFVWIGGSIVDDFYGQKVEEFLKINKELQDRIFFLPFRKDAVKLMADFDIFLLTSDSEGMPLSVLEARSLRIPVVSTNVGCVSEIIEMVGKSDSDIVNLVEETLVDKDGLFASMIEQNYNAFIDQYFRLYKW